MIQHIVINGGGPTGWLTYGALKYLFEKNFIHLDNIKSIYGTSAGAILGVIFLLHFFPLIAAISINSQTALSIEINGSISKILFSI